MPLTYASENEKRNDLRLLELLLRKQLAQYTAPKKNLVENSRFEIVFDITHQRNTGLSLVLKERIILSSGELAVRRIRDICPLNH